MFEALQPRVILDVGLGVEAAKRASVASDFKQFESADELHRFLVDTAVDRWKDLFGATITHWPSAPSFVEGDVVSHSALPGTGHDFAGDTADRVSKSFDDTNVHVTGVDEADIVRTDGEFLYIANEGHLSIVDARNPAELSLAAEIPFDAHSGELFVSTD